MTCMKVSTVVLILVLSMTGCACATGRLEDVGQGRFKASGTVRQYPDRPPERLFCRMAGSSVDGGHLEITGRCANATNSAPIKLWVEVVEAGTRYRMIGRVISSTPGHGDVTHYTGTRRGPVIIFSAGVTINDVRFESRFVISIGSGGIRRIVETVTQLDNGKKTKLIDLMVRRD